MIRIVKKQRVPTVFGQIRSRRSDYDELLSSEKDESKKSCWRNKDTSALTVCLKSV